MVHLRGFWDDGLPFYLCLWLIRILWCFSSALELKTAAIIFCTSRLASPLQTWETLLKITNKGHLQMLQKGGILPCVDCAGFGKWNYSTVLFNKVKRSYCSNWCLCTVITLWTNALDKFNLIRFPWQMSHEKSILGAAICQVRITFEFFFATTC